MTTITTHLTKLNLNNLNYEELTDLYFVLKKHLEENPQDTPLWQFLAEVAMYSRRMDGITNATTTEVDKQREYDKKIVERVKAIAHQRAVA